MKSLNMNRMMKEIIEFYGEDEQLTQSMEELAELSMALNKWRRKKSVEHYDNIIEEIADVEIMIAQVMDILNIKPMDIYRLKEYKLKRQMERIAEKRSKSAPEIENLEKLKKNAVICKDCGFCFNDQPHTDEIIAVIDELIKYKRKDEKNEMDG